jgi:DNA replication protein DnaC
MILKNVAHQAVVRGHTVRFATASDMLADLAAQESSVALARRLHRYTMPRLLCIDEVGYLVTRRYDTQKPVLLSTNKAFTEWSELGPRPSSSRPPTRGIRRIHEHHVERRAGVPAERGASRPQTDSSAGFRCYGNWPPSHRPGE